MPTRSFHELVQEHVADDPAFAEALLREGIEAMLGGDVDAGKAMLRDYIKATAGFEKLGQATRIPAKSLIRMFGPRGNPQARNLFDVIRYLQEIAGLRLQVLVEGQSPGRPSLRARKPRSGLSRRRAA
jgi:DNA-binding phage protein